MKQSYAWWIPAGSGLLILAIPLVTGELITPILTASAACVILLAFLSPDVALLAILAAFTVPVLLAGTGTNADAVRLASIVFILALVTARSPVPAPLRAWRPNAYALPVVAAFATLSLLWTVNTTDTVKATGGLVCAAVIVAVAARKLTMDQITRALAILGWAAAVLSLVALILDPTFAIENHRLRGIFWNANMLCMFLIITAPAMLIRMRRFQTITLIGLVALCVGTASRMGTAALLVEGAVLLAGGWRLVRHLALLVGVAAAYLLFVPAPNALTRLLVANQNLVVLRTYNSRADGWAAGMDLFNQRPALGFGYGTTQTLGGGLVPDLLVGGGLVFLAVAAVLIVGVATGMYRAAPFYLAVVAGGLIDAMAEPWLFVGGSETCLIFWMIVAHPQARTYRGPSVPGVASMSSLLVPLRPASSPRWAGRRRAAIG